MRRREVLAAGLALGAAAAMAGLLAGSGPALAQGIGEKLVAAKQAGTIGERPDGLVGAVSATPPADVLQLVAQVNQARRAQYEKIATQNGLSATQVGAVAGKELLDRTPAGQYVLSQDGVWAKK